MSGKDDLIIEWLKQLKDGQDRLQEGQEKIAEDQKRMDTILSRNTDSLEDHIKRTELLENRLDPIEEDYKKRQAVKDFKSTIVKKIATWAGILSAFAAIVALFLKFGI